MAGAGAGAVGAYLPVGPDVVIGSIGAFSGFGCTNGLRFFFWLGGVDDGSVN